MNTNLEDDIFVGFIYKRLDGYPLNIMDRKGQYLYLKNIVKVYYNEYSYEYGIIKYDIQNDKFYIDLYNEIKGFNHNEKYLIIKEEDNTFSNILEKVSDNIYENLYKNCIKNQHDVSLRRTCEAILDLNSATKIFLTREECKKLYEISKRYIDFKIIMNFSVEPKENHKEFAKALDELIIKLKSSHEYKNYFDIKNYNVKAYVY